MLSLLRRPEEYLDLIQALLEEGRCADRPLVFKCQADEEMALYVSGSIVRPPYGDESCFVAVLSPRPLGSAGPMSILVPRRSVGGFQQLASAVAHDLNNVLSAVVGYCHLLKPSLSNELDALKDLASLEDCADRAAVIVRQLVVLGQPKTLRPEHVTVREQLERLGPVLRRMLGPDVALSVEPPAIPAAIRIDRQAFDDILIAVALNARSAMPKGGVIELRTRSLPNEKIVQCVVTSTARVTSLRAREGADGDVSLESFSGRVGLALSSMQVLVAESDGTLVVENAPGLGTTVRLSFPAASHQTKAKPDESAAPRSPVLAGAILVVEDEPMLRELVRRVLTGCGYTVLSAGSGEEALNLIHSARDESIVALITDIVMPGLSGWEVGRVVRQRYPHCAMIFVSGNGSDEMLDREMPADAVFMAKPFAPHALLQAVQHAFRAIDVASPSH